MDVFWDTMYIANTDVYVCACIHACLCQSSKNFPLVKQKENWSKLSSSYIMWLLLCCCCFCLWPLQKYIYLKIYYCIYL